MDDSIKSNHLYHKYWFGYEGSLFSCMCNDDSDIDWIESIITIQRDEENTLQMNICCNLSDTERSVIETIALDNELQIYDIESSIYDQLYLFYIIFQSFLETRILYLSVESEEDKNIWIEALIDSIHGGVKQIYQPEIWCEAFYPSSFIGVTFFHNDILYAVENGNILDATQTQSPPQLKFHRINQRNLELLTIIMIDIDSYQNSIDIYNSSIHWLLVNISTTNMTQDNNLIYSDNNEVIKYNKPAPEYKSGLHRFFFIVFEQNQLYDTNNVIHTLKSFQNNFQKFDLFNWSKSMDLGSPIGINGFYQERQNSLVNQNKTGISPTTYGFIAGQRYAINVSSPRFKSKSGVKLSNSIPNSTQGGDDVLLISASASSEEEIGNNNHHKNNTTTTTTTTNTAKNNYLNAVSMKSSSISPKPKPATIQRKQSVAKLAERKLSMTSMVSVSYPGTILASNNENNNNTDKIESSAIPSSPIPIPIIKSKNNGLSNTKQSTPTNTGSGGGLVKKLKSVYSATKIKNVDSNDISPIKIIKNNSKETKSPKTNKNISNNNIKNKDSFENNNQIIPKSDLLLLKLFGEVDNIPILKNGNDNNSKNDNSNLLSLLDNELDQLIQPNHSTVDHNDDDKSISTSSSDRIISNNFIDFDNNFYIKKDNLNEIDDIIMPINTLPPLVKSLSASNSSAFDKPNNKSSKMMSEININNNNNNNRDTPTQTPHNNLLMNDMLVVNDGIASDNNWKINEIINKNDLVSKENIPVIKKKSISRSGSFRNEKSITKQNLAEISEFLPSNTHVRYNDPMRNKSASFSDNGDAESTISSLTLQTGLLLSSQSNNNYDNNNNNNNQLHINYNNSNDIIGYNVNSNDMMSSYNHSLNPSPHISLDGNENNNEYDKNISKKNILNFSKETDDTSLTNKSRFSSFGSLIMTKQSSKGNKSSFDSAEIISDISNKGNMKTKDEIYHILYNDFSLNNNNYNNSNNNNNDNNNYQKKKLLKSQELCDIFNISTKSVFEGETIKKKFSQDFLFKDSFIWINPYTKSLHWAKSMSDKNSKIKHKCILLDRSNSYNTIGSPGRNLIDTIKPDGETKGILSGIICKGGSIKLFLESNECLELKFGKEGYPAKRAKDWTAVIRTFMPTIINSP
eukprot:gene9665-13013_t